MKKSTLIFTLLLFVSTLGFSQDKKFSIGFGIGGGSAKAKSDQSESEAGFGLSGYVNAMYNINERISAGLEYNSNAAVIGDFDGASIEATSIRGILAKGKYRLFTGKNNIYGGLNAGLYSILPGKISFDDAEANLSFKRKSSFGIAPEIGIHIGSFQIATSYHFAGKYKYESEVMEDETVNYNLWQFTIGWNISFLDN